MITVSDAAKLESTLKDMTVYAALEASADLTVKFRMNPVSNYTVSWFMADSAVQDTDITNAVKGEHIQTTYSILNVTKSELGNYTVQVINHVIMGEPNEAKFFVTLELRGENNKAMYGYATAAYTGRSHLAENMTSKIH